MNVIGHQHEGMNATALPLRVILKLVYAEEIVVRAREPGLGGENVVCPPLLSANLSIRRG